MKNDINHLPSVVARWKIIGRSLTTPSKVRAVCLGCNIEKEVVWQTIKEGSSQSCVKCRAPKPKRHGMSGTKVYRTWQRMLSRCRGHSNPKYRNYGGRGITVCERWWVFDNFYADMGGPPTPAHSLDRMDNDGNYEPNNCRWATLKQQANNKQRSRFVVLDGKKMTVSELSEELGLKPGILNWRLHKGWPLERAITAKDFRCK